MNRLNLARLAIYLNNLALTYSGFDMGTYTSSQVNPIDATKPNECGTVGCAVGHAICVPDLPPPVDNEGWDYYGRRIFFPDQSSMRETLYSFFFSGRWADFDNTSQGAAKRIWFVLMMDDAELSTFAKTLSTQIIRETINEYSKLYSKVIIPSVLPENFA